MAVSRRNGRRSRATLLFLILTSLTVITLDFRDDGAGLVGSVRNVAADVLAPVRDGADAVLSPVGDAFSGITGYGSLEDENARLRARIAELEGAGLRQDEIEAELRELRALVQLDDLGGISRVTARVVAAPVSNFEQTIELDRGTADGVRVDMPVVTGTGLVGRVVRASGQRSVVRLVTDPSSSVGVRLSRSGETGIAEGRGVGRTLSVGFIDAGAEVLRREIAVTSGLEGGSDLYPPGIPVGRVTEAAHREGEIEQQVALQPVADLAHLRYVQVLQVRP